MSKAQQLETANLHFNDSGTPVADDFDDVYFSNDDGLAESQYVFISGNQLLKRWKQRLTGHFTIAETGFGSGMNFLACWQAFSDHLTSQPDSVNQRLHFVSFEKFPMTQEALALCHQQFPSLSHYANQLRAQYPTPTAGCHRLHFLGGKITLDLWFGDVNELITQIPSSEAGVVDAWFLDGFAPSKNPEMWTNNLFTQMFRLAKPQASVATFTAAGLVRRGLAEAGFDVKKIPGYGNKREMVTATKPAQAQPEAKPNQVPQLQDVAIIGGGIAACFTAWELAQRGYRIKLLCADDTLADQASGNRQGALYPLLNGSYDTLAEFYSHAYRYSLTEIKTLTQKHPNIQHEWCGVLHLNSNEELTKKHQAIAQAGYPESVVKPVDAQAASEWAGIPLPHSALLYSEGGWLCPGDLCRAIATELSQQGHSIELKVKVEAIKPQQNGWQLLTSQHCYQADAVVIAAGTESTQFEISQHFPLNSVRGQVSHMETTTASAPLKSVLCHTGYLTPAHNQSHCMGATFVRNTTDQELQVEEQQLNLERLANALPNSKLVKEWQQSPLAGRVGFRATLRDHLPLAGPIPIWEQVSTLEAAGPGNVGELSQLPCYPNLYIFTGLGARGICSAPLGASIIAAHISGESQQVSQTLLDAVHPGRFVWRRLKKNKPIF